MAVVGETSPRTDLQRRRERFRAPVAEHALVKAKLLQFSAQEMEHYHALLRETL